MSDAALGGFPGIGGKVLGGTDQNPLNVVGDDIIAGRTQYLGKETRDEPDLVCWAPRSLKGLDIGSQRDRTEGDLPAAGFGDVVHDLMV